MSFLPGSLTPALLRSRRHKLHITRFRASTKSSFIPLLLLSPKSLSTFRGPRSWQSHISFGRSFNFEDVLSLCLNLDKQKEPITQSTKNRREHSPRFKVMFYVIGSENSKSGSVFYDSRQQNQKRGGAVRHFRCTDTVSDETNLWWNIGIQLFM